MLIYRSHVLHFMACFPCLMAQCCATGLLYTDKYLSWYFHQFRGSLTHVTLTAGIRVAWYWKYQWQINCSSFIVNICTYCKTSPQNRSISLFQKGSKVEKVNEHVEMQSYSTSTSKIINHTVTEAAVTHDPCFLSGDSSELSLIQQRYHHDFS